MNISLLQKNIYTVLGVCILYAVFFSIAFANTFQVATTVALSEDTQAAEGMVVVSYEETETYAISSTPDDARVYGVIASLPPVVFATGVDEVPVITEGVTLIQVTNKNGQIKRGDLLITATSSGLAMRAGGSDKNVFAIALENYESNGEETFGLIQAEIGVERAHSVRAAQQDLLANQGANGDSTGVVASFVRRGVATVLVIGALFFLLYSFRSAIVQGVVSIGRNPRARRSIVTLSFANIMFALVLCAVVVFIAIAILILPI